MMRLKLIGMLVCIMAFCMPVQSMAGQGAFSSDFETAVASYSKLDIQAKAEFKQDLLLSVQSDDVAHLKLKLITLGRSRDKAIIEELWPMIGVLNGDSAADAIMEIFIEHDFSVSERFHAALRRRFGEIAGPDQVQSCLDTFLNPQLPQKNNFAHALLEKARSEEFVKLLRNAYDRDRTFGEAKAIFRLLALQNTEGAYHACSRILEHLEDDSRFSNNQERFLLVFAVGMFTAPELKSVLISDATSPKYWKRAGALRCLGNYTGQDVIDFLQSLHFPRKKSYKIRKAGEALSPEEMLQNIVKNSLANSKRKTRILQKKSGDFKALSKAGKVEDGKYSFRAMTAATLDDLAQQYRPVIKLSGGTRVDLFEENEYEYVDYIPMAVDELCNNTSKMPQLVSGDTKYDLSQYLATLGNYDQEWHLDFSPLWDGIITVEAGYRSLWSSATPTPTVYCYAWYNPNKVYPYAVQYWFFYFYNNWANNHPGDWETITIFFENDREPREVVYSTHNEANRYYYSTIDKEDNGHPHVYVSNGGHGSYPIGGATVYTAVTDNHQGDREIFGPVDTNHSYGSNYIGDYNVLESLIDSYQDSSHWIHFGGKWGNNSIVPGFTSPKGPKFRTDAPSSFTWYTAKNKPRNPDTCDERYDEKIFGENGSGPWIWAEGYSLGQGDCVKRPELLEPSGISESNPVFQWNTHGQEGAHYFICVFDSDKNLHSSSTKYGCSGETCSYQFPILPLEEGRTYYWAAYAGKDGHYPMD